MATTKKFQKVNTTRFLVYNQHMNKIEQQPYFTSDWHLFHKRIQQFCPFSRKGSTLEEMNELIIYNVINTVPEGGDLWNLGDITFGKYDETKKLLRRISDHCNHHLILGNHDDESELRFMGVFASIQDYKKLKIGKTSYILCHFPIESWDSSRYGSTHLHGHRHSNYQQPNTGKCMDVGIDTRAAGDMKPYSLEEIRKCLQFETRSTHHGD